MSKVKKMGERKLLIAILMTFFFSLLVSTNAFADMYWKDYNGEDQGGYMPDIDQNQDFDKVEARSEQNDPGISYTGTWTTISDPGASGGSRNYASHPASFTFSFTGSSIKWITTKAYNRGISEVWIDGNLMTTVDLYDPNVVNQVLLYSNSSLSSGPHTIQIKSTNTKNPASSGVLTSNDALDVDDIEHEYCAPVAEANSLWWLDKRWEHITIFTDLMNGLGYIGGDVNGDGVADILDFVQELAWYKDTNGQRTGIPHTGTTVLDEQAGIAEFLSDYGLDDKLYEHTAWDIDFPDWMSFFNYLEEEVELCQDVKLDLGFWHVDEAIPMGNNQYLVTWSRRGGHAVTVAGVDSQNNLFAISDPDNDTFEAGLIQQGVVRPGPHGYPHNPAVHNNEMFASHDIYTVGPSPSPGGKMGLLNFPFKWNLPSHEWEYAGPIIVESTEPLEYCMTFTEIEAAVIISPTPFCGDGIIGNTPGETCDPPGGQWPPNGNPCDADCTYCGDGNTDADEQCDDGNNIPLDGCENDCTVTPPYCGDGNVDPGEECDDGNTNNGDGCDDQCKIPDISVSPSSLAFGKVTPGLSSASKTVTVKNDGNGKLEIGTISLGGTNPTQFSIPVADDHCSGQLIAPSGSCTVDVKFSPTSTGAKSAALSIPSDDPDAGENPANVSLTGNAVKVKVTSPNGGESWKSANGGYAITWQTSSTIAPAVATTKLLYTMDGGTTWKTISSFPGNPGTYTWYIPKVTVTKNQCKVKVVLKNAANVTIGSDMSDKFFKITP